MGNWTIGTVLYWTDANTFWTFIESISRNILRNNSMRMNWEFMNSSSPLFFALKQMLMVQIIVSICGSLWLTFSFHSVVLFKVRRFCHFSSICPVICSSKAAGYHGMMFFQNSMLYWHQHVICPVVCSSKAAGYQGMMFFFSTACYTVMLIIKWFLCS